MLLHDSVEMTEQYKKIEDELDSKIKAIIGEPGYLGYCYRYWDEKKRILLEDYGIEWKSPADLNPTVLFD